MIQKNQKKLNRLNVLSDAVLIVLWSLATAADVTYLSVVICFCMFLVNDLYGFVSWRRMQARQHRAAASGEAARAAEQPSLR